MPEVKRKPEKRDTKRVLGIFTKYVLPQPSEGLILQVLGKKDDGSLTLGMLCEGSPVAVDLKEEREETGHLIFQTDAGAVTQRNLLPTTGEGRRCSERLKDVLRGKGVLTSRLNEFNGFSDIELNMEF